MKQMDKRVQLRKYGQQLWTRDLAREVRTELISLLEQSRSGDKIFIDADEVDVWDFSFANELFGKSILSLPNEYPGRFLIVENLGTYTRENLAKALESLNLAMIEYKQGKFGLIGKVHPAYLATFEQILKIKEPVTANTIKDKLEINLTAANERLTKLTTMGLIRREKGTSQAGREQYLYSALK
jgi:MFS superfamily sulfate permease-like transporter